MVDVKQPVYPILLAGGTGSRLWPVSRELYPKQLVNFIGKDSLVQSTIKRLAPVVDPNNARIVCGVDHIHEMARHMADIGIKPEGKIISEPCGRNTAPAILLAVIHVLKVEKDAILCIFPADHVIRDIDMFHEKVELGIELAETGHVVTFGIEPHYPETGYGYIEGGDRITKGALAIKRFVEKPDHKTAEAYIEAGNFFWNSGMFVFKASIMLEEFRKLQPDLLGLMENILSESDSPSKSDYELLPDLSIDYAIMEKTDRGVVVPSGFGWSDIGSWKSLYDFLPKNGNNNVIDGDVIVQNAHNCFIQGYERLIAVNNIRDIVVIETPDSIFISDMETSRDVKTIVSTLKETGRDEYHQHRTVYHPWGKKTLLEAKEKYKVTRLVIRPECLYPADAEGSPAKNILVVSGSARLVADKKVQELAVGQSALISKKFSSNIENSGDDQLVIIQTEIY
ncbi:MAG: mannose-1-phosphate guanylyltransferase/mannose-6-phosphate isomerase [Desulfobacterales bacterium]|nr:mannose-1-phosphate guanylyltransferase/mannose-6-phosphate isomerase [Desulfobacterales bacterium]